MRIRQLQVLDRTAYHLSSTMGYIVICLNPFIYASRYEVFKRQLKHMMNRSIATASTVGWITDIHPTSITS